MGASGREAAAVATLTHFLLCSFEELSPVLGAERSRVLMSEADIDGDGGIDLAEFQNWWTSKQAEMKANQMVHGTAVPPTNTDFHAGEVFSRYRTLGDHHCQR